MKTAPIKRDIIVIGASAGGVPILKNLCRALPADLPAVIGIVLHRGPWYGGNVSDIYGKPGCIAVQEGKAGDQLEQGTVYFAPSDHHLLFGTSFVHLSRGPKVHFARPAIDQLFFSAARTFHTRVAGLLLTGANQDGAHGLAAIKKHGGATFCTETGGSGLSNHAAQRPSGGCASRGLRPCVARRGHRLSGRPSHHGRTSLRMWRSSSGGELQHGGHYP
jgi:two-component system chemotaxis response regulator CheB